MKSAWLIRPLPHGINRVSEFRKAGIAAIGWPGIGDLTGKTREELKSLLSQPPYSLEGLALGNAYATIDIFVNQMKEGDLVLMPNGDDIYLGEITSGYFFDANFDSNDIGYSHQKKVNWLTNTSRKELSKELRSSLKVHRTAANLSHHEQEIEALSTGKQVPISDTLQQLEVTYPLRPDFKVTFHIPSDITSDEAQRLSTYFASLYFKK